MRCPPSSTSSAANTAAGLECPAAVLTDYHLHLRPDEENTPPEEYFTPGNVERYQEIAEELRERRERLGVSYITVFEKDLETLRPIIDLLHDQ